MWKKKNEKRLLEMALRTIQSPQWDIQITRFEIIHSETPTWKSKSGFPFVVKTLEINDR